MTKKSLALICVLILALFLIWQFVYEPLMTRAAVAKVETAIEQGSSCQRDEDCMVIGSGACAFGCYIFIITSSEGDVNAALENAYERMGKEGCDLSCPVPPEVFCDAGRCTAKE